MLLDMMVFHSFYVVSGHDDTTHSWNILGLGTGVATVEEAGQPLVKIKMPIWRRGNSNGGTIIMNLSINGTYQVSKQIVYATVSGGGPIIKQPDLP